MYSSVSEEATAPLFWNRTIRITFRSEKTQMIEGIHHENYGEVFWSERRSTLSYFEDPERFTKILPRQYAAAGGTVKTAS
jgi:hypothetical protein